MSTLVSELDFSSLFPREKLESFSSAYEFLEAIYSNVEDRILRYIDINFEQAEMTSRKCFFHIRDHTSFVVKITNELVQKYIDRERKKGGSPDSIRRIEILALIAKYAALFHDVQQEFRVETTSDNGMKKRIKKANTKENEEKSAQLLELFLEIACSHMPKSDEIRDAIRIGVRMIWNTMYIKKDDTQKFEREGLKKSRSFFESVVAIADLCSAYIDPIRTHIDGNRVFLETQLWIFDILEDCFSQQRMLTEEEITIFLDEYVKWEKIEVSFLEQRKKNSQKK